MNCPFCSIDKQKTVIIRENKNTLVVFSNPKLMDGHLLVIPRKHVEKLSELNKEDRNELFQTVIDFQEKILAKVSKGCDIRQNYRPFQEQNNLKVNHLHIHLQPRDFEDKLYSKCQIFEKGIFGELDKDKAKLILELLR